MSWKDTTTKLKFNMLRVGGRCLTYANINNHRHTHAIETTTKAQRQESRSIHKFNDIRIRMDSIKANTIKMIKWHDFIQCNNSLNDNNSTIIRVHANDAISNTQIVARFRSHLVTPLTPSNNPTIVLSMRRTLAEQANEQNQNCNNKLRHYAMENTGYIT